MNTGRHFRLSVLALLLSALPAAPLMAQDDFRWNGQLRAGDTIAIHGINGPVEARFSDSGEVVVDAFKKYRRSDPESVRIEVVEHDEGVTICAIYEGYRPGACTPSGLKGGSTRNNDVQVQFVVQVPAGVNFRGHTVNGAVQAIDLESDVDAKTVNGGIEISTLGIARAQTVNGSIEADMDGGWEGDLSFTTVNGSIDLAFSEDLSAEIDAKTLNGRLNSDFPMDLRGRQKKRYGTKTYRGLIGSGKGSGRTLKLETVNGGLNIRRSGGR